MVIIGFLLTHSRSSGEVSAAAAAFSPGWVLGMALDFAVLSSSCVVLCCAVLCCAVLSASHALCSLGRPKSRACVGSPAHSLTQSLTHTHPASDSNSSSPFALASARARTVPESSSAPPRLIQPTHGPPPKLPMACLLACLRLPSSAPPARQPFLAPSTSTFWCSAHMAHAKQIKRHICPSFLDVSPYRFPPFAAAAPFPSLTCLGTQV